MTAESVGMRMKSYYDRGHLCRISYHPRPRIALALADAVVGFEELPVIQPVATLCRRRHRYWHCLFHQRLFARCVHRDPGKDGQMDGQSGIEILARSSLTRKSEAAPTGFEPVSPP
jgi:hypothetical protein